MVLRYKLENSNWTNLDREKVARVMAEYGATEAITTAGANLVLRKVPMPMDMRGQTLFVFGGRYAININSAHDVRSSWSIVETLRNEMDDVVTRAAEECK